MMRLRSSDSCCMSISWLSWCFLRVRYVVIDSAPPVVLLALLRLLRVVPHEGEVLLGGHGESADVWSNVVSRGGF